MALVCREREVKGQKNESASWYYLTGLRVGAAELAGYIRNHWGIENGRNKERTPWEQPSHLGYR